MLYNITHQGAVLAWDYAQTVVHGGGQHQITYKQRVLGHIAGLRRMGGPEIILYYFTDSKVVLW